MAQIHLVLGPVGAGKSTLAERLSREHRALRFTLDEWMTDLFRPDRPDEGVVEWYRERSTRCVDLIWKLAGRSLELGADVILEIGLIFRRDRERLYARADAAGHAMTIYVLDAPREVRRERVEERNRDRGTTFSMHVPPEIFEMASDLWEPLDEDERAGRDVRLLGDLHGSSRRDEA